MGAVISFSFMTRIHPKVSDRKLQVNYGVLKNGAKALPLAVLRYHLELNLGLR